MSGWIVPIMNAQKARQQQQKTYDGFYKVCRRCVHFRMQECYCNLKNQDTGSGTPACHAFLSR